MGSRRTRRPSAGGRIAAAALAALLALGGASAALADEAIVVDQEGIEATGGAAAGQEGAGSVAAQADRLGPQTDGTVTAGDKEWSNGTYTVTSTLTISNDNNNRVTCTGEVTLVLNAGCTLTVPGGITVAEGATLTIKGSGELVAGGSTTSNYYAGIGGSTSDYNAGTINIEGGTVKATGGYYGAGIGGGGKGGGGTINITGGTVTATGGERGAGIGGGGGEESGGNGGKVTITGGTVTATGGAVDGYCGGAGIGGGYYGAGGTASISGSADVMATGAKGGAGIGGGYEGAAGTITISGSADVTATGGGDGAGIGGGYEGAAGTITIDGGTVTTKGGSYAVGVGCGQDGDGGTITINGGMVEATGGVSGAGIGGGCTINIYGGTVKAASPSYMPGEESDVFGGAGIGGSFSSGSGDIHIYGGEVEAKGSVGGAGIGGGAFADMYGATAGTVTINGGTVNAKGGVLDYNGNYGVFKLAGAGIGGGAGGSGGTVAINGGKVKATGGKASETVVAQGIGCGMYSMLVSDEEMPDPDPGTLAIGSGRVLYGSDTDIPTDVKDESRLLSGATESYAGDRFQYMVVNGNKLAAPALSYAATSLTKAVGDADFTNPLTNGSGAAVAYESSDTSVATVDSAGKVTIKGTGTTTITATYAGDDTHEGAKASYTLTVEPAENPAVTLKFRKAKVTKAYGAKPFKNKLAGGSGVTVTYESSNKKVAKVNKTTGVVTLKGPGTATITATFAGDATHEAATASYKLVVKLAKTRGLKTVCHPGKRTVDVSWGKVKGAKSYQVQWRLRGGKWRTRATEGTSLTLTGMRAKGYYEIRVRAVSGKRRGAWSTTSRRWYVPAAGVRATSSSGGRVEVSWSKTKRANKGYLVLVRYSEDGPIVAKKTVGKGKTSATISGLKSGKSAWVSVRPLRRAYGRTWVGVLTPIAGVEVR